jgi:hypothetical protein
MSNLVYVFILLILLSIIIGISLQNLMVNDISELKWIQRFNLDNGIILFITILYNNFIFIFSLFSFILCGLNSTNNKILIIHFMIIILNTVYLNNNINTNLISLIFIVICIDVLSFIHIIFLQRGEGIWYYFLYQSIITIFIWWIIVIDNIYMLGLLYFYKLGSGGAGYYIPNLYYNILNYNIKLMIYVGTTNIILMYNPIFLLSTIDYEFYNKDEFILSNFLIIIYILFIWITNGYLFVNNWLYCISFSTIILSNIYFLFLYISYNLFYYVYYFTITSIVIWYILILTLYFIVPYDSPS